LAQILAGGSVEVDDVQPSAAMSTILRDFDQFRLSRCA
jgi:hypothetical protein